MSKSLYAITRSTAQGLNFSPDLLEGLQSSPNLNRPPPKARQSAWNGEQRNFDHMCGVA